MRIRGDLHGLFGVNNHDEQGRELFQRAAVFARAVAVELRHSARNFQVFDMVPCANRGIFNLAKKHSSVSVGRHLCQDQKINVQTGAAEAVYRAAVRRRKGVVYRENCDDIATFGRKGFTGSQ